MIVVVHKVISGGQTGADQAGLRAAEQAGLATGGWAPRDWMTEAGPAPWLATYGLREHAGGYRERTIANVAAADATLWFGDAGTPGYKATVEACQQRSRTHLHVRPDATRVGQVLEWLAIHHVRTLNVAGNRASKFPGIDDRVVRFLGMVFAAQARGGHAT